MKRLECSRRPELGSNRCCVPHLRKGYDAGAAEDSIYGVSLRSGGSSQLSDTTSMKLDVIVAVSGFSLTV